MGLSLGFSDEGGTTAPPGSERRRILIVIVFQLEHPKTSPARRIRLSAILTEIDDVLAREAQI
jgi:hypothetical protein